MLNNFWFQISAIIYRQEPVFLCLTYLLIATVSVTFAGTVSVNDLHDTDLRTDLYFWPIASTMFIDKKALLFLLITSMISFRGYI